MKLTKADTGADETAVKRQEALDTLTGIEVDFAALRDRLYEERMSEAAQEALLLYEGTHPELVRVTALIEQRRQHAREITHAWQRLVAAELERTRAAHQERIWASWRAELADLRTGMLDATMRKRRQVDRERRSLDRAQALQGNAAPPGLGYELAIERDAAAVARTWAASSGHGEAGPKEKDLPEGGLLAYAIPRGLDANVAHDLAQVGLLPPPDALAELPPGADYEYARFERRSPPPRGHGYPEGGYWP